MSGTSTYDPGEVALSQDAVPVVVARYDAQGGATSAEAAYTALPNVRCLQIQFREGPDVPTARFDYLLDDSDPDTPYPTQFDHVWPLQSSGDYVVRQDDELVVLGITSTGAIRVLFHGFASIPQVNLSERAQAVSFVAHGVHVRAFDRPIGGARYRDADAPDDPDRDTDTDLPTRFNPVSQLSPFGEPNCTPDGQDELTELHMDPFPVFLDAGITRTPDPRTYWDLGKFVRYLLNTQNADQEWFSHPAAADLDDLLKTLIPTGADGDGDFDPADAGTFEAKSIPLRDCDYTFRKWPDALAEQLGYAGFAFRFGTDTDANELPDDFLEIYRKDSKESQTYTAKDVFLPASGVDLDPAACNLRDLHAARDHAQVTNQVRVVARRTWYELSVVLAPWFVPTSGDTTNTAQFDAGNSTLLKGDAELRRRYRMYVFDEAGDGHWDYTSSATITGTATDLTEVLGIAIDPDTGDPLFANRLRPGKTRLVTENPKGKPLKAELAYSTDYNGACPAVWGRSGTWISLGQSNWRLLQDRLGIECTAHNPEKWTVPPGDGSTRLPALSGITAQASPTAQNPRFYLRLTTVIEGDEVMNALAGKRPASPSRFAIQADIDAKDHFQRNVVTKSSAYNNTGSNQIKAGDYVGVRDDRDRARAHANQVRSAHEMPRLAGTLHIPWLTNAYDVADLIGKINGRDIELYINPDTGGEAKSYPTIVGMDYNFDGEQQSTVLHLSDRRGEAARP